jgi:neutral trehalase
VCSAAAFIPLWAGIATQDQAQTLVERHLTDPMAFWTPYPVASYARSEPDYTQHYQPPPNSDPLYALGPGHANWCGGMWPHWNYFFIHGLAAYGFGAEASHIAGRFYAAVAADPLLYEWYDAETGAGHGLHPFCAGASALGAFLPAELALGVDPTLIACVDEPLDLAPVRESLGLEGAFAPS